ncbi:helix-turn-helix transcriptional regulator [Streptomyces sp. NPDC058653]|uniref:helix-turn-helix transcriptional regulator n=1 Tax=Streptomyces sp. NPDC058653 TaxID=3346576 RepID=UPI003666C329
MTNETADNRHLSEQASAEKLTRPEFARMARVDVSTVKRWARKGIGPRPIRLGPRVIRYDKAEVRAYLNQGEESVRGAA